jgi:hypothetical protein
MIAACLTGPKGPLDDLLEKVALAVFVAFFCWMAYFVISEVVAKVSF